MNKQEKLRTAIILCGGRGTRLGILSKKNPKTLVKIQNKEILWYIINILRKNKFNHFILPLGYRGEQIKKFVKKSFPFEKNIQIINTGINTSIALRIHKIKKFIKSENFLLLNGDVIFNFNLDKIYKNHIKKKMIMTFISFAYIANFGTVGVKKGKVVDFRRNMKFDFVKSKYKKDLTTYVYSGISMLNKIALSKDFRNSKNFEKKLYPLVIKKFKCNVEAPTGFFHPIDNIKDIKVGNNKDSEGSKYFQINKIIKMINKLKKI